MTNPMFPELFPVAMGNEEETMLMTGTDLNDLHDPVDFVGNFNAYLPESVKYAGSTNQLFASNGSMVYDGGSSGETFCPVNLERTTPECSSPRELATYIQANEDLVVDMLGNYVRASWRIGENRVARLQRRVIDSQANGRGCHDNLETKPSSYSWLHANYYQIEASLLNFLATRSFITGAGYANSYGLHFGQKVAHIKCIDEYGHFNSAYRLVRDKDEDDTGPRIEIRCNDINISPWATQVRLGGAAMFVTAIQTPLLDKILKFDSDNIGSSSPIDYFHRSNYANMTDDWQLRPASCTIESLDYQERVLELFDKQLGKYIPLGPEYRDLIAEMRQYCNDFRQVMTGAADFTILANRSDMAAKFALMKHLAEKSADTVEPRRIGNMTFRALGMQYDSIIIRSGPDGKPRADYGYGYRLRDSGAFKLALGDTEVQQAYHNPPETTRAKVRGALISTGLVSECGWNKVTLQIPTNWDDGATLTVDLPDPLMQANLVANTLEPHKDIIKQHTA